jgi:hypothetical protein
MTRRVCELDEIEISRDGIFQMRHTICRAQGMPTATTNAFHATMDYLCLSGRSVLSLAFCIAFCIAGFGAFLAVCMMARV